MGSALAHQADVELHRTADDLSADPLIVAVDGAALLGGEIHGGEAVNMVADGAVMTAVAALYHQVRGNKRALPSACHGGSDLIPRGAVGLTDGTGVHALDAAELDGVIADDKLGATVKVEGGMYIFALLAEQKPELHRQGEKIFS